MKSTELKGLAVVSIGSGEKLGTISEILLDSKAENVTAFEVETGGGGMLSGQPSSPKQVTAQDVHAIGPDALTVQDASVLRDAVDPGNTLALSAIMDEKVVTEGGTYVGKIASVDIDEKSMVVNALEVSAGFFKSNQMVAKADFVTIGDELVIVHDSVTAEQAPVETDRDAQDMEEGVPPTVTEIYGGRGTSASEQ